jgi:hypothetical protein
MWFVMMMMMVMVMMGREISGFLMPHRTFHRDVMVMEVSRRDMLNVASSFGLLIASPALSAADEDAPHNTNDVKKPFASLENLLPAARVKWTIDQAVQIAAKVDDKIDSSSWVELQRLLLEPRNYTQQRKLPPIPDRPAKEYLDTYQKNREQLNVLAQPGALLVQSGEIAAWKRLKRQERRDEEADEIRAALNVYTSALNYRSDAYMLNVPPLERSQMIRQDRLPDVTQVIQSDMGMRYLVRNELLTTMQEVRAELEYQLKHQDEEQSLQELLVLLKQAQAACDQWFRFIDEQDVRYATLAVEQEQYESAASKS